MHGRHAGDPCIGSLTTARLLSIPSWGTNNDIEIRLVVKVMRKVFYSQMNLVAVAYERTSSPSSGDQH